ERDVRAREPRDRVDAEDSEEAIEDAAVLVEDRPPRRACDDERKQPWQEQERTHHARERELLLEEDREAEPDRELARKGSEGEERSVDDRRSEQGARDGLDVVAEADPRGFAREERLGRVVLQAHRQVLDDGIAEEEDDVDRGRYDEHDLRDVVTTDPRRARAARGERGHGAPLHGGPTCWAGPRRDLAVRC